MTDDLPYTVTLGFDYSRASGGEDIAALLRASLPDAVIQAKLDEKGAVTGYTMDLCFPTPEAAVEASFALTQFFQAEGVSYYVGDTTEGN